MNLLRLLILADVRLYLRTLQILSKLFFVDIDVSINVITLRKFLVG